MAGIMDDSLEPIVKQASECLDKDLFFTVDEDDKEPHWKTLFLVFICLKRLLTLSGILH